MYKLTKPGRVFFAIGTIGLAVLSIINGEFLVGRPPAWPETIPGRFFWAYLSGAVLILGSVAIIMNKMGRVAALVIGLIILIYSFLLRQLPEMAGKTWEGILWSINAYKTLALSGGALIIAASFSMEKGNTGKQFITDKKLAYIGIVFVSLFFIIGGCSHFKYADFVKNFIPAYIPFRGFWAYFCGITLIAGGIGILFRQTRKLAAILSGAMVLGWFLLLHIPRFIAAPNDPSDRMGLCESLAISGILFVLAAISSNRISNNPRA